MASATTAAPVYDRLTSPHECEAPETPTSPQQEHNVSMLKLLITAMPRMAIVMCWSAQWAVIGPYLATMLPNYAIQLTQVAGPLTGLFFNPIIGILSDRSTNKYGRRRPILIGGALSSVLCCMVASYAREISAFVGHNEASTRHWTAALMVLCYIWMDVTINVISTPAYLLVADVAGDRQLTGAAMAEGWATFGSILVSGYIQVFGPAYLSLHYFLAMLAIGMILSVGLVCLFVNEVPPSQPCKAEPMHRRVLEAFGIVQSSLRSLPRVLVTYCFIFFCVQYGFAAYSGNKGQFFGLVVFGGSAENADKCGNACTKEQLAYSHGVQLAGGFTDLLFNVVAYTYSWIIPLLVKAFGAKRVLTCSLIPQACLIAVAFCQIVAVDVVVVVAMSLSQSGMFALLVPVIVHVVGHQAQIGIYVGALNSASSLGQLLNFALGAALVETSMGYRLPVFIGGLVSAIAVVASIFVLKLKMHSL